MKKINRLPPKLKLLVRVAVPIAFVSLCVGLNAIAFTEIRQSIQSHRADSANSPSSSLPQSHTDQDRKPKRNPNKKTETLSPEPVSTEAISPEPVTIQNTATVGPRSNQVVSVPAQTQRLETQIALRPVSTEGFVNDPQPISITPVLEDENISIDTLKTTPEGQSTEQAEAATATSRADAPKDDTSKTDISSEPTAKSIQEAAQYGHLPYTEGSAEEMMLVASYAEGAGTHRAETLQPEAAEALLEMIAAARVDGIWLIPASGFRTIAEQRTLFNAQIERKGSPEVAAKVSAPPGYSEHHTGYAVDLADGTLPQNQDISDSFAESPAYQWLLENAATHSFELSFPEGNKQGISFEPWHWRYVGSVQSREQLGLQTPTADTRNTTNTFIE